MYLYFVVKNKLFIGLTERISSYYTKNLKYYKTFSAMFYVRLSFGLKYHKKGDEDRMNFAVRKAEISI